MVTGASTAQAAIVLVDARNGLLEQSRRHAYLSALLGIRHMVACVNKMDLVDWDEGRFREIERDFAELAQRLGVVDALGIPVSALLGDNVVDGSEHMPWYDGPPLLGLLERLEVASDRNFDDVRLPVQWTVRAVARARRLPRLRRQDGGRACSSPATRCWCCRAASARRSRGSTRSRGRRSARSRRCR